MSDFMIQQGTDSGRRWPIVDSATDEPLDLTGWTVKAQVRPFPGSTELLHTWSTSTGNATTTSDGWVWITWTSQDSAQMGWEFGAFDIELTSPTGKVTRIDSGTVWVSAEVTL